MSDCDTVYDKSVPLDQIQAYEDGELEESEVIALFQNLVDTGLAWQLQGSYGRTAIALIEAGHITQYKEYTR